MDDGRGVDVEAQTGPVNGELREPEPIITWSEAALWCLPVFFSIVMVVSGIVYLSVRLVDAHGVPVPRSTRFVAGFAMIAVGSSATAFRVYVLVKEYQQSREVEAITRRHMVPVSPP